ncbi:MAG: hypothetical protein AB3X44_08995 [Leptothrix sp. (in: b-proteobacteria)]
MVTTIVPLHRIGYYSYQPGSFQDQVAGINAWHHISPIRLIDSAICWSGISKLLIFRPI